MSAVAFGVFPGERLASSPAPMAEVGSVYLPVGAAWFVTFGAVMALTTSLNSTMLVPSRLVIMLARDGLAPRWLGAIVPRAGTPVIGLALTLAAAVLLVVSGQVSLALNIAVFALVVLYFLHSFTLLVLPRKNPSLFRQVTARVPLGLQRAAAVLSMLAMGGLIVLQVTDDAATLSRLSLSQRIAQRSLTTLELCLAWAVIGVLLYALGRRGARPGAEAEG
jgi:APA family basic amino acid/polyamine antiporter